LYTSNVSWKRALTANLEQIFSEAFRYAAYEDVELGYRLSRRGLTLRYLADAVGYHLHPMTARSFFERMRRVGAMRTVLAAMHPRLVGSEGLALYQDLEIERRLRLAAGAPGSVPAWESIVDPLVTAFECFDEWAAAEKPLIGAAANHVHELERRVLPLRRALFDDLCETFQQIGQAQEWARESSEQAWVAGWIAMQRLAQRDAEPRNAVSPPAHQAKTRGRLKRALLQFAWVRAAHEWLREAKRGRRKD
jgi:hypothetical protein